MGHCPNCGEEYQENQKFCANCGRAVGEDAPPIPPEPDRISVPTQQVPPPAPPSSDHQQRGPGIWSGVKLGCGMFIVLPILPGSPTEGLLFGDVRQAGTCISGWSSRETAGLCIMPFSTPALPASSEGVSMKVSYYPDTDSLFVKLKPGVEAEGSEVVPGIVFHYTSEGEVTAIDIDSKASEMVDLSSLEVEGLPLNVLPTSRQESKAV